MPATISVPIASCTAPDMSGWRHTATDAPQLIESLLRFRNELLQRHSVEDIIVLGMGGSALGARIFVNQYASLLQQVDVRIRIVDTTEPDTIREILRDFNVRAGLVIVASKSGSTIEPLCLKQIFFQHVKNVLGSVRAAAARFICISDEDTSLTHLARQQQWRGIIVSPENVGGRFSVMTAFGLAPLVLAGIYPADLLESARTMQERCLNGHDCPAQALADSLYQNYLDGRDKLVIGYTDQTTQSFARWLEQLIAESLGKEGTGLIPLPMSAYRASKLQTMGLTDVQSISIVPATPAVLGAELMRWMFAIEHLAQFFAVNPFNQPNVEASKQRTRDILNQICQLSSTSPRQITLQALLSDNRIMDSYHLPNLLASDSYIVLMSWAPETPQNRAALERLAANIEARYRRPATIAVGPHYLHASGQLYKGGPDTGVYILLAQNSKSDLAVPGAAYSLGQLHSADLAGEIDVMSALGRPLVRLS